MPTRALKMKLIVPRDDSAESMRLRRALFATHRFVNEAVAHYERLLLEMRQGDVCVGRDDDDKDVIEGAEIWRGRLRERLEKRGIQAGTIEAALPLLADLYRAIVKSSVKEGSGSGQDGRNFHGSLVSDSSEAMAVVGEKLSIWRPLLARLDEPAAALGPQATEILDAHPEMLKAKGAPLGWVKRFKSNDPSWAEALVADLKKTNETANSPEYMALGDLRGLGALPLAEPLCRRHVEGCESTLVPVERMAFALAVGHLNSWESWGHRARAQLAKRIADVSEWEARYAASHADALALIRDFEQRRAEALRETSLANDATVYTVRSRELRGWQRLRDWLRDHAAAVAADRAKKVADLQTELGRGFGDAAVLGWLAAPEQAGLAAHPAGDVVSRVAAYNALVRLRDRTRACPQMTFADALKHPRYGEFDPPSNANSPPFTLAQGEEGLELKIELLCPVGPLADDRLRREMLRFKLAPSGQFRKGEVEIEQQGKKRVLWLRFRSQDRLDEVRGQVGGSALLFERHALEQTALAALANGTIGGVYLKIGLDRAVADENEARRRKKTQAWLRYARHNRAKAKGSPPEAGFSILAIDLGLRTAATGAVFRLAEGGDAPAAEAARWGDDIAGLRVRHERSFLLNLPGEEAGERERGARKQETDAVLAVRACLAHLRTLGRVYRAEETEGRLEALAEIGEELATPRRTAPPVRVTDPELAELGESATLAAAQWQVRALRVYRRVEHDLGLHIQKWRAETRRRTEPQGGQKRHALGGKSAWAVEHEEKVRKTLIAWHRHQDPTRRELARLDRRTQGTIARRLLDHINHLKEDRVKTTADLIVQAARGLVYRDGRWEKLHAPVDLIVLEDLSRYRFRTDRAPAENRQLMQWSHREVDSAIRMQAELYGIAVADTGAAFSSRFDALTLAPGCRCRTLTAEDLKSLEEAESWVARRLEKLHIDRSAVRIGDLVPWDGGELFASPVGAHGDGLRVRHADINAAQNIGLRFLNGHQHAFRLGAARLGGEGPIRYINKKLGERAQGALGGKVALIEALGDVEHELRAFPSEAALIRALGIGRGALASVASAHDDERPPDEEEIEQAAAQEELLEASSDWETFFRDPSGSIFHGRWVPAKHFWGRVRQEVTRRLRAAGKLHG